MKERPILFTPENVKKILDGKKTQTRRVVKLPDFNPTEYDGMYMWSHPNNPTNNIQYAWGATERPRQPPCPYGVVGDHLWVREAWNAMNPCGAFWDELNDTERAGWKWMPLYKASEIAGEDGHYEGPWRPSIHMPRQFARLFLEVTDVRVERLQDISEDDAWAEGCSVPEFRMSVMDTRGLPDYRIPLSLKGAYANLWESINGKTHPWASNPWVWVISFKEPTP